MDRIDLPKYHEFLWPALLAVRELGGSGSIDEINEVVLRRGAFDEAQQAVLHGDGPSTELEYRMAWARTYLKGMGLMINSQRGIWSLTEQGKTVSEAELGPLRQSYIARTGERRRWRRGSDSPEVTTQVSGGYPGVALQGVA